MPWIRRRSHVISLALTTCLVLAACDADRLSTATQPSPPEPANSEEPNYHFPPAAALWSADHEEDDPSVEWHQFDVTGDGYNYGLSSVHARSGSKSLRMVIVVVDEPVGVRAVRNSEIKSNKELYMSCWYYIPRVVEPTDFWNLMQLKSVESPPGPSDPIWLLTVANRPSGEMYLQLDHHGEYVGQSYARFEQSIIDIPVAEWFNIEWHHVAQSGEDPNGRVQIWQDGVELWNMHDVHTRHPSGKLESHYWSVNNYSSGFESDSKVALYVDDCAISRSRIWPRE